MIGIYKIENNITHQVYIGQSVDIKQRWIAHKAPGVRSNPNSESYYYKLYTAMREYGLENFTFTVIEECNKEDLNAREIYWIKYYDSYVNGYNMTLGGNYSTNSSNISKVYQYNLDGTFIKEYNSVREAAEQINGSIGNLYTALSRNTMAYNYQWSYLKLNKLKPYTTNAIPVIAFSTDTGERIQLYTSLSEAIFYTGDSFAIIKKSCDTHHHSGKYQWRYWIEDPNLLKIPPYKWDNKIAVDQYDLNGVYLNTYSSLEEASLITHINANNLSSCCHQRQKSCGGYLWVYHNEPAPKPYQDNRIKHTTSSNRRKIAQFTKNDEFIEIYTSAHEAARAIDKPKCANHITECCQGKRKTCEGYIWKYCED